MFKQTLYSFSALALVSMLGTHSIAYAGECTVAVPTNNPGFCASFKTTAQCQCSNFLPKGMCADVEKIYSRMLSQPGARTLELACEKQKYTTKQVCIDGWNCYRLGGKNSKGERCSSTGQKCA